MARAYSQDLRERVIDAGTSARQAAERFGIGIATAIVWVRRAREGERSARKQGQPKRSKLDQHREFLLGLIEAEPTSQTRPISAAMLVLAVLLLGLVLMPTFSETCEVAFQEEA